MKKNLSQGDNHPAPSPSRKFVGAEVDIPTYEKFRRAARHSQRSVSGLIRWLMDNADDLLQSDRSMIAPFPHSSMPENFLPKGDNHLAMLSDKTGETPETP